MKTLAATALALALPLAGCGPMSVADHRDDLANCDFAVHSQQGRLANEAKMALGEQAVSGDGKANLILDETTNSTLTSLTETGRASKRRLRYALHWRVEQGEAQEISGEHRQSQLVNHSDNSHRANKLVDRRFFDHARDDGIQVMVADLARHCAR